MSYGLFLIPLLSAFIGWITIRLLAWMLFHPRQPKKIFGLSWQGIVPGQQQKLAIQAGKYVSTVFPLDDIEKKITDPKNFENVKPLIETHIDDFLRNKLKEQMPMISMFIGDKTITSLKVVFIQEIENLFPQVMQQFSGNLKNEFNLADLVNSKIAAISPDTLEELFRKNMAKQIRVGGFLAALIGLVIGLLQLTIIFFAR